MASQESGSDEGGEAVRAYAEGWQAISSRMDSGSSWSGHERNCAYLSLGDGSFIDASAVLGLDHIDDSRAAVAVDWDGDGDLDLWLRNRGGPQLRFLMNRSREDQGGHFITLELEGRSCNRDAVGARVELRAGGEKIVRERRAGQGYLAQSSPRMTIPLGAATAIDSLFIHWPGGDVQELGALKVDATYRVVQGSAAVVLESSPLAIAAKSDWQAPLAAKSSRVVLRTPLPLEPGMRERLGIVGKGPRLLLAWAPWCASCLEEIGELSARRAELDAGQLGIVPICLDVQGDEAAARALYARYATPDGGPSPFAPIFADDAQRNLIAALLDHIAAEGQEIALPASLLVNDKGFVEILYRGPLSADALLRDAGTYGVGGVPGPLRSAYGGRWLFGSPRDLGALARELRLRGRRGEGAFYDQLHRYRPRSQR